MLHCGSKPPTNLKGGNCCKGVGSPSLGVSRDLNHLWGPLKRLQIPKDNAPQGPSARMKAKVQGHVSVCVSRPVTLPCLFLQLSTLAAILWGRLWNLLVQQTLWSSTSEIGQSEARSQRKTPPLPTWRRELPRSSCGERERSSARPIRKEN